LGRRNRRGWHRLERTLGLSQHRSGKLEASACSKCGSWNMKAAGFRAGIILYTIAFGFTQLLLRAGSLPEDEEGSASGSAGGNNSPHPNLRARGATAACALIMVVWWITEAVPLVKEDYMFIGFARPIRKKLKCEGICYKGARIAELSMFTLHCVWRPSLSDKRRHFFLSCFYRSPGSRRPAPSQLLTSVTLFFYFSAPSSWSRSSRSTGCTKGLL